MRKLIGCSRLGRAVVWGVLIAIIVYPLSPTTAQSSGAQSKFSQPLKLIDGIPGRGLLVALLGGCAPAPSNKGDVIDCTGIVSGGVQGKGGNDTITVVSGGVLTTSQTGIAGGKGDDTLVNHGHVVVASGGDTATATGIAGAVGDDDIQNHSSIDVTATAANSRSGIVTAK